MNNKFDDRYLNSLRNVYVVELKKDEPIVYTYKYNSIFDFKMKAHHNMRDAIQYAIENKAKLIKNGKELEFGVINRESAYYIQGDNIKIINLREDT